MFDLVYPREQHRDKLCCKETKTSETQYAVWRCMRLLHNRSLSLELFYQEQYDIHFMRMQKLQLNSTSPMSCLYLAIVEIKNCLQKQKKENLAETK